MKNKNKKAIKFHSSEEEAEKHKENMDDGKNNYWIELREGNKYKRCEYCPIKNFCNQYVERHTK